MYHSLLWQLLACAGHDEDSYLPPEEVLTDCFTIALSRLTSMLSALKFCRKGQVALAIHPK